MGANRDYIDENENPRILIQHQSKSPFRVKLSMDYCMARALLDRHIRMAQFSMVLHMEEVSDINELAKLLTYKAVYRRARLSR